MDSSIWAGMSEYFPKEQSHFVDLGFTNNDNVANIPEGKHIFIAHSLGALWALKNHAHNMAGLIAINGFTNFSNFVDKRVLCSMQKQLQRNPLQQMHSFWDAINLKNNFDQNLNTDRLHEGLEWLINWDMSEELRSLNIPTLSLIGGKDPLLPIKQMEKEWSGTNIKIIKGGGHILPLSHPKQCAQKIKDFIIEYKLEE